MENSYTNAIIKALMQRHLAEQQAMQQVMGSAGQGAGGQPPNLGNIGRIYGDAYLHQQKGEMDQFQRMFGPGGQSAGGQLPNMNNIAKMYGNAFLQQNQAETGADLKIWQALVDYLSRLMPER